MRIQSVFLLFGLPILTFVISCQNPSPSTGSNAISASPKPSQITNNRIELTFPTYPDGSEAYYYHLLEQALIDAGYEVVIEQTPPLPQQRAITMLENGQLSIIHLLQSEERDSLYVPIHVNLTNGLIGHRILLIPPKSQTDYAKVENIEDFRNLEKVGAFGKGWFDVQIWEANNLTYKEIDGEWRKIYEMLAREDRGIDYFSRGFTEIVAEADVHPDLAIESELVFVYDRDFLFYLSPADADYAPMIENALQQAQASGLLDELIQQYWQDDFAKLDFENRTKIILDTPE